MSAINPPDTAPRWPRLTVMTMEGFVSVAALIAGLLFIVQPDGSLLGVTPSLLSGTPFSDYTVPGLLLLLVVGCGTLLAAASVYWHSQSACDLVMSTGFMLVVFEVVEGMLIGFNPQQALIGLVGVALIALAFRLPGSVRGGT